MKVRKFVSLAMATILALGMASCGSAPAGQSAVSAPSQNVSSTDAPQSQPANEAKKPKSGDKWKIGLSISFTGNAFRALTLASLEQEVERMGNVDLTILDGQNDINKQVSDLESLIAMDVDGILVLPGSAEAVEPVLTEARNLGIPVGVFDKQVFNPDAYDFYVGPNDKKMAELLTTWLFDKIGGKGNIVQLGGAPGNSGTAIWLGVCKELIDTKYPDIKILAYQDTNWKEDTSKQVMTDLLLAYPGQIDAIWCDGSQSAAGAIKACLSAGVDPLPTTGNTAYCSIFRLYMDNHEKYPEWDMCVSSKPASESRDSLRYLIDMLNGKPLPGKDICPDPQKLIMSESASKLYDPKLPDSMYVDHDLSPENLEKLLNSSTFAKK